MNGLNLVEHNHKCGKKVRKVDGLSALSEFATWKSESRLLPSLIKDVKKNMCPFHSCRHALCWLSAQPSGWVSSTEKEISDHFYLRRWCNVDWVPPLLDSSCTFSFLTVEELWTCFVILHLASLVVYLVSRNFPSWIFSPKLILNCDILFCFAGTVCPTSPVWGLSLNIYNQLQKCSQSKCHLYPVWMCDLLFVICFPGRQYLRWCRSSWSETPSLQRVWAGWSVVFEKGAGLLLKLLKQPLSVTLPAAHSHTLHMFLSQKMFLSLLYASFIELTDVFDMYSLIFTNFNEHGLGLICVNICNKLTC